MITRFLPPTPVHHRAVRLGFLLLCLFAAAETLLAEPKGVIFYRPFHGAGDAVTVVKEYRDLRLFRLVVNFDPDQPGATEKQVERNLFIGYAEYPNLKSGTIKTKEEKDAFLQSLRALSEALAAYPNAKRVIGNRVEELKAAAQLLQQGNVLVAGKWSPEGKPAELMIGGRTFLEAKLVSVTNGRAQVRHAGGVIGLEIAKLTPSEIESLNATAPDVKIWKSEFVPAPVP